MRRRGGPVGVRLAAVLVLALAAAGCGEKSGALTRPRAQRVHLTATPVGEKACLILTEPDAENALLVNSGAQVQAPACDFHVDSRAQPAATLNADSRLNVAELCVAGDIGRKGGLVSAPLRGCAAAIDPFKPQAPPDAPCDDAPHAIHGGTVRMKPGTYCGGLAFNGAPHVAFAPGLYVIRGGDWTFNGGDYTGQGVSFRFADTSKVVLNSGIDVDLSAPDAGPRKGVLIDEAPGLPPTALTFNDARRLHLNGIVDLPSRRAVFNAGSTVSGDRLTLVFRTAVLNQTRWAIAGPAPHP